MNGTKERPFVPFFLLELILMINNKSGGYNMIGFFRTFDKVKPLYDALYKFVLLLCKLLLIADIGITSMAVAGRYIPFIPDPSWSEEVVLSLMAYMAVLSAALAIRQRSHIRMTAFDGVLPRKAIISLDIIADLGVLALAVVMIVVGWQYAIQIGGRGTYVSMPFLSRFWMYFPIPLAGVAMLLFLFESLYSHLKALFGEEEEV